MLYSKHPKTKQRNAARPFEKVLGKKKETFGRSRLSEGGHLPQPLGEKEKRREERRAWRGNKEHTM